MPSTRGPAAPGTRVEKPGDRAIGPAQRGMLVALAVALLGGIAVGARFGVFGALLGAGLGAVAVFALVPVAIGALTLRCRLAGLAPGDMEDRIAALATWGLAAAAPLAATPFVSFPDEYSAHWQTTGGATWLQVDRTGGTSDHRSGIPGSLDPAWGLHVVDVNIALGNLVDLVRSESAAFR